MNLHQDIAPPVLIVESPSFMGLGTEDDDDLYAQFDGREKYADVDFASVYVHGKMQDMCGFDIAGLVEGTIRDVDEQEVVLIPASGENKGKRMEATLLSRRLPHTSRPSRCGYFLYKDEVEKWTPRLED